MENTEQDQTALKDKPKKRQGDNIMKKFIEAIKNIFNFKKEEIVTEPKKPAKKKAKKATKKKPVKKAK
jgi:hypothetical protein|tara:strand:+ start:386 stop:589 length:204 start_codon:yes stop_codon:yes gene_type:complete